MKHKKTDSFVFRREYYEFLKSLSDSDFRYCFDMICAYAFDCEPVVRHPNEHLAQELDKICRQIDRDLCAYQKRCSNG